MNNNNSKAKPKTIRNPNGAALYYKKEGMTIRMNRAEAERFIDGYQAPEDFTAPETVHIEITGRCNLSCSYCYVPREAKDLDTSLLEGLFAELSEMNVFQITFGGGEPFMRKDCCRLAQKADSLGLNVTATTNGTLFFDFPLEDLRVFRQLNISWHRETLDSGFDMGAALHRLRDVGIPAAISFIVSRDYEKDLPELEKMAREHGASVLLLSYKPVHGDREQVVPLEEIRKHAMAMVKRGMKVGVDSLLSGTCHQSERLATICSNGDVHPCSFIREPLGNVKKTRFGEIWKGRREKVPCPYLEDFGLREI